MLRPSRPMIRPFISSLGRLTVVTVTSEVTSVARRWIVVTRMSRAFLSARELGLLLDEVDRDLRVVPGLVLEALDELLLGLRPADRPDMRSSSAATFCLSCSGSASLSWAALSPGCRAILSCFSRVSTRFSRFSSFCSSRRSMRCSSILRSRVSRSSWLRSRSSSSLLSRIASFFFASASFSASLTNPVRLLLG